jgi:S1-C subfamily serine protease
MTPDSIACLVASLMIVGVIFLFAKQSSDDSREQVRKQQELLALAENDPQPEFFIDLAEMALAAEQQTKAMEYLRRAVDLGSAKAAFRVAQMYHHNADDSRWFEFMLRSAELGGEVAMREVAAAFKGGRGTLKNIGKSTHWLLRSAESGNAESMTQVALAYIEGYGVSENPMEGLAWLYVAEFNRNETAAGLIKTAEAKLNNSLILMAQDRAKVIIDLIKEGRRTSDSSVSGSSSMPSPGQVAPSKPKHESKGSGSGAVVSSSGHVVTAAHVIKGSTYLEVVTPTGTHPATVLSVDDANDVALLKVDQVFEAHIPVGRSSAVRLGQSVATIGFPNIGIQGHSPKVTQGMISGENGVQNDIRMWQISVPIQPGNSGGPLLDEHGHLVGVVVASLSLRAIQITGSVPQNVNYAIKGAYLEPLLNFHKVTVAQSPSVAPGSFQDMVAAAQKASVLILVY